VLIREQEGGVTGGQVTVKVMRGGREIREIERPLHVLDGRKAVVFRRKLWEVKRGNRIVIDEHIRDEDAMASRLKAEAGSGFLARGRGQAG